MSNQIKYEGELELSSELKLPCYVLEDGTRVLSGRGTQDVLKVGESSDRKAEQKAGDYLGRFLSSKWFKSLKSNSFELAHFEPTTCYKGNQKINGYEATTLIDLCNVLLQAREDGELKTEKQLLVAAQAEILVRSFAKVGLIALIDEATGYQYDREEKELQVILKALVSDEILQYQKQFQLTFYKEIFRLWDIPFTAQNIRHKPQFIGHLTNKYIYSNLPKGTIVLEHLKAHTPKTEGGNWKYKLHQSLTEDKGREALKKVLYTVEALASISRDKNHFERLMREKYGAQKELPFPEAPIETSKKETQSNNLSDFNQKLAKAIKYNSKQ